MIRRRRGDAPPALARERARRVAQGMVHPADVDKDGWTDGGYGPAEVREALRSAQKGRCAYCATRTVESRFDAIDHFRPREHYWWLTWTWENLWLACQPCQGKSDRFPLEAGAAALGPPTAADMQSAFALSSERPLLLDPGRDSPRDHLCVEEVPNTGGGWFWAPTSERGKETVDRLHLDVRTRRSDYERLKQHIERRLAPAVAAVKAAVDGGDIAGASARWHACGADFLWRNDATEADFLVPSWWYLRAAFECHDLGRHGMRMWDHPDDGVGVPADPQPGFDLALDPSRTTEARLHATYIRGVDRAPRPRVEAAIVALCVDRPSTVGELAADLDRAEGTLGGYLSRLVGDGRLVRRGERFEPPASGQ